MEMDAYTTVWIIDYLTKNLRLCVWEGGQQHRSTSGGFTVIVSLHSLHLIVPSSPEILRWFWICWVRQWWTGAPALYHSFSSFLSASFWPDLFLNTFLNALFRCWRTAASSTQRFHTDVIMSFCNLKPNPIDSSEVFQNLAVFLRLVGYDRDQKTICGPFPLPPVFFENDPAQRQVFTELSQLPFLKVAKKALVFCKHVKRFVQALYFH